MSDQTAVQEPNGDADVDASVNVIAEADPGVNAEADPGEETDAAVRAWRGLRTLVLETADVRAKVTEALGMSHFRAKALRHIAVEGPLTLSALAAGLFADAPHTTVTVEHLVRRGLVTRDPNPADRRSKLVAVTAEGAAAAAEMTRLTDTPPPALRDLPAEDLAALERIVSTLTRP
ncbi:MarR family transcriptional regulator [Streptomyces sp. NBC_01775]|uniref:MarR family winged helix-turn-helix transcriptional regulator n=1 Tax=Streptomyces sp. NBC_01775 TaxID=2975939 RepID=UPI002DD7B134|nr:MarR family transcriptional regulator [Streptomyces sp. NBC_01775]WSB78747.1 MarR family transcriptional regulator [Streptomyces sp. NBC_01775]